MITQTPKEEEYIVTDEAWEAIQGGYDLHVHVAPDVIPRRIDDLDLAKEFLAAGLKGFCLKSHYVPTAERAQVVAKAVPGIEVFGAVTLNHSIGGLNPMALEIAGRSGSKMVWFPTVDAANETAGRAGGDETKLPFWAKIQREMVAAGMTKPPLTVIDENGKITDETAHCLEIIRKYQMILATGHLGRNEIFALVKAAREIGIEKVVVTHAEFPSQNLSAEDQMSLANAGALIEHCFTTYYTKKADWETVFANIRAVGVERSFIATDLGQSTNPGIAEGFAMYAQKFLDAGFGKSEINRMAAINPFSLIS